MLNRAHIHNHSAQWVSMLYSTQPPDHYGSGDPCMGWKWSWCLNLWNVLLDSWLWESLGYAALHFLKNEFAYWYNDMKGTAVVLNYRLVICLIASLCIQTNRNWLFFTKKYSIPHWLLFIYKLLKSLLDTVKQKFRDRMIKYISAKTNLFTI